MGRTVKLVDRAKMLEHLRSVLTAVMVVLLQVSLTALLAYFERVQDTEKLLYLAVASLAAAVAALVAVLQITKELSTVGGAVVA